MRALLRPLSTHTVFSPIETIVAVFVLATLAYFHILDGIKHSSFFSPTFPLTLRPANARLSQGEWMPVTEREWLNAWKHGDQVLELQQISFSLDDRVKKVSLTYPLPLLHGVRPCSAGCGWFTADDPEYDAGRNVGMQPWTAKPWGYAGAPGHPFAEEWWAVLEQTPWRGWRETEAYRAANKATKERAIDAAVIEFRKRVETGQLV